MRFCNLPCGTGCVKGEKRDPEKLRLEREELERRQKEGVYCTALSISYVINVHLSTGS